MILAQIAIACILSAGGIAGIIVAVIHFATNQIATCIEMRYEQRLEKEKSQYETRLNYQEHISKARFDRAFQIYQELSEKNMTMVYSIGEAVVLSRGGYETDEDISQFIQKLCNDINNAELVNKRMAPFIEKSIFERYTELEAQASEIFVLMKAWNKYRTCSNFLFSYCGVTYTTQTNVQETIEEKQKILSKFSDDILDYLRDYLKELDTISTDKFF